jgi:hypothetical protein
LRRRYNRPKSLRDALHRCLPNAPFSNGQVVILMTDGINNWGSARNHNGSICSPTRATQNDRPRRFVGSDVHAELTPNWCNATSRRSGFASMISCRVRRRFGRSLDGLVIMAVALGSFVAMTRSTLTPRDVTAGVAVIFPPWINADEALLRSVTAGARFVGYGRVPFIVVVVPEASDYLDRVLSRGALFALDPRSLAGCLEPASLGQSAAQ